MTGTSDGTPHREGPESSPAPADGEREAVVRIEIYASGTGVDVHAPPAVRPGVSSRRPTASTLHPEPSPPPALLPSLAPTTSLAPVPAGDDAVSEVATADVRRRERRVRRSESELRDRHRELEDRETAVEIREAELEVAFGLREERIERREAELAEREERLQRKESDLARYVGQVQAQFARAS